MNEVWVEVKQYINPRVEHTRTVYDKEWSEIPVLAIVLDYKSVVWDRDMLPEECAIVGMNDSGEIKCIPLYDLRMHRVDKQEWKY